MKAVRAPIVGGFPLALAGVVAWIFLPTHRALIVEITLMALLGVVLIKIVRDSFSLRRSRPSLFDGELDRSGRAGERPDDLVKVERVLGWRFYDARDFHRRVRPLLKELIAYRLKARYGVDPEVDPESARALLPAELAQVVDASEGPDAFASTSLDARFMSTLLSQIEAI
jgi:hypothetical protein